MLPRDCQESAGFLWFNMATQPWQHANRYKASLRDGNYYQKKPHQFLLSTVKNKSQLSVISMSLVCERWSLVLMLISDPFSASFGWLSSMCDVESKSAPLAGVLLDTWSHYVWIWWCWQPHDHQASTKDLPVCKESMLHMYRPIVCLHLPFTRNKHMDITSEGGKYLRPLMMLLR